MCARKSQAKSKPVAPDPMPAKRTAQRRPATATEPFWRKKPLAAMTKAEWESLCDGCGRCCTVKFEDEDTGHVDYTDVVCREFDTATCRCRNYARRKELVPDCIKLTVRMVGKLSWLPSTCAYRLIDEGKDLYWWHPLVSGDPETVHEAGISLRGRVVSEDEVEDAEERIVDWIG